MKSSLSQVNKKTFWRRNKGILIPLFIIFGSALLMGVIALLTTGSWIWGICTFITLPLLTFGWGYFSLKTMDFGE